MTLCPPKRSPTPTGHTLSPRRHLPSTTDSMHCFTQCGVWRNTKTPFANFPMSLGKQASYLRSYAKRSEISSIGFTLTICNWISTLREQNLTHHVRRLPPMPRSPPKRSQIASTLWLPNRGLGGVIEIASWNVNSIRERGVRLATLTRSDPCIRAKEAD